MKIVTVVGARPQFIQGGCRIKRTEEKTSRGAYTCMSQRCDYNMSDIFFEEMDIPKPDYNLGIAGGTHGPMTGEDAYGYRGSAFERASPRTILLYGDTNSTMAGAFAAVKLGVPVVHVEAGNRLGIALNNPEEVNRIVTDHVSTLKMCCTASAMEFLKKEGIENGAHLVGDPMYDAF